MKKHLLALTMLVPTVAAAGDSVYAWGPWAEGVKPAAGSTYVAASPVAEPTVEMRESIELLRQYNEIQQYNEIRYSAAPPAIPGAPQLPGIVICTPACPSGSDGLGGGSQL